VIDISTIFEQYSGELLQLRAEFLSYALTTARADREKLEHAIANLYNYYGRQPPTQVIWFASPIDMVSAGILWHQMLSELGLTSSSPFSGIWFSDFIPPNSIEQPGRAFFHRAQSTPMPITAKEILPFVFRGGLHNGKIVNEDLMISQAHFYTMGREIVWAFRHTVRQQVESGGLKEWLNLSNFITSALLIKRDEWQAFRQKLVLAEGDANSVTTHLRNLERIQWTAPHSPIHDAFTIAPFRALKFFGVELPPDAQPPLLESVIAGGWWWAFKDVCFACDNPTLLRLDEQERLHSEDEIAIQFEDGWGFWSLHGVRVPERVVLNQFSAVDIDNEANVEVRRTMIERYGLTRYFHESGAEELHRDEFGILYRKHQEGDEPIVLLKVTDASSRPDGSTPDYLLRVPPYVITAREAAAWTFGMEEQEYKPSLES
jgi:hypothetical protein